MNTSTRPFWSVANLVRDPHVMGSPSVMLENINSGTGTLRSEISNNDAEKTGTPFKDGDILFGKLRPYLAKSWHATWNGVAVGDIHVYRPYGNSDSQFLNYVVQSGDFLKYAENHSYGTKMPRCEWSSISRFQLADLTLETQQRIADYLDRETAEIDAAVADLDRYLELLEKRKKTLAIKHIFPHGFPQNLLSANDYLTLGYRSVQRIGSFAELRKKRNEDPTADYLSLLKGRGVIPYEEKGNVGNKKPQDITTSFMVEEGDYLVNSMNFGIGSFGRSSYSGVASAAYLIFRVNEDLVNPDFLQFVFENDDLRAQAQNLGNGILEHRKSINWDRFRAIYVPMPPRRDQDAIVDVLSREKNEIDDLIAESTKLRELLLKRRSVLITEVVTGRKQV